MKKFLSLVMALIMVVSVMTLAGCKKSSDKTTAELFVCGLEQLVMPELVNAFVDLDTLEVANRYYYSIDELTMSAMGEEVLGEFPKISLEAVMPNKESAVISLDMALGEEKLGGTLEVVDGEKIYLSLPDATDIYFVSTLDEFIEKLTEEEVEGTEGATAGASSMLSGFIAGLESMSANVMDEMLKEENFEREGASAKVFGDEIDGLDKITLNLDGEALNGVIKEMFNSFPEEMMEGAEMPEIPEEVEIEISASVYMDEESLKKFEFEVKADEFSVECELDVENTDDTYKCEGDVKIVAEGEEVASIDIDTDVTLEDGELEGKTKIKPTFNLPEAEDENEEMAAAMLEDLKITMEYEGEVDGDEFEAEISVGVSLGGVSLKIPFDIKGKNEENKLTLDMDCDTSIMGMVDMKFGYTVELEQVDDVKSGSYDESKGFGLDDEDKMEQFVTEVSEYVDGLVGFAEFFSSFEEEEPYPEDDMSSVLFSIYNDEIDMYFYENGTGYTSSYYDAVIGDEDIKILENGEEVITITQTSDTTADILGMEYTYVVEDYGDGDYVFTFTSDVYTTEFYVYAYDNTACIDEYFSYSMDDTTLTIDESSFTYEIDEENGTINLNGVEYSYFSYAD